MWPTYVDGKINLVNHLAYCWTNPRRGDVIAFRQAPNVVLLKRIVGLPGERVRIEEGHVLVNGALLNEPYAKININNQRATTTLPSRSEIKLHRDEYYVIGDNRGITVLGPISVGSILGKVLF
jgi:signal peptidase I